MERSAKDWRRSPKGLANRPESALKRGQHGTGRGRWWINATGCVESFDRSFGPLCRLLAAGWRLSRGVGGGPGAGPQTRPGCSYLPVGDFHFQNGYHSVMRRSRITVDRRQRKCQDKLPSERSCAKRDVVPCSPA